jgi:YHS domain-containing protein
MMMRRSPSRTRRGAGRMSGLLVVLWLSGLAACDSDAPATSAATASAPASAPAGQQVCPITQYDADVRHSAEYRGKRVYFCCEPCRDTFLRYPDRFSAKLPQFGGTEPPSLGRMPGS